MYNTFNWYIFLSPWILWIHFLLNIRLHLLLLLYVVHVDHKTICKGLELYLSQFCTLAIRIISDWNLFISFWYLHTMCSSNNPSVIYKWATTNMTSIIAHRALLVLIHKKNMKTVSTYQPWPITTYRIYPTNRFPIIIGSRLQWSFATCIRRPSLRVCKSFFKIKNELLKIILDTIINLPIRI